MWGSDACFSSPRQRAGPVLLTLLFFPLVPSLLSFARFYTFFSAGQALLSTLSWCSACTSVSEGVFLMYPWREMSSTSTNSSTILFSKTQIVIFQHCLVEHFCYFSKVSFLRETFFYYSHFSIPTISITFQFLSYSQLIGLPIFTLIPIQFAAH